MHRYRLFISHAWAYNADYYRMVDLLDKAPNFIYSNYSVPQHDPLDSDAKLKEGLRQQIRPVEVVVVLSGMYVAYSDWVQFEIDYATELTKPILGVQPWGSERTPAAVSSVADMLVGWNTGSIVSAIRLLAG